MDYKEASQRYRKSWKGEVDGHAGDPDYIDFDKLVFIGSGGPSRRIIAPAAISYNNMRNAIANKWSFEVGPSTFRPLAGEIEICKTRVCDGKSKAKPGYSRHGWGRAVDFALIYNSVSGKLNTLPPEGTAAFELFTWLCENALSFGWVNYLVESWHWEYVGEPPGVYVNPALVNPPDGNPPPEKNSIENPKDIEEKTNDNKNEEQQKEEPLGDDFIVLDMNQIWNSTSVSITNNTNSKISNEGNAKDSEKNPEILTLINPDKKSLSGEDQRDKQKININIK